MTSDLLASATYKYVKADGNIAYIMVENEDLITTGKVSDAPEEVKTGDNTMLIIPVIIGILAVIGIILLIIRIRRSKR